MYCHVEGATHYVPCSIDGVEMIVLLQASPEEDGCEAEGFGSCAAPYWQPLDQEGGPGPCCTAHIAMGGPGDVRPLPAPEGSHTHL